MVQLFNILLYESASVGGPLLFQRVICHFKDGIDFWMRSLFPSPCFPELFNHFGKFIAITGKKKNRSCFGGGGGGGGGNTEY